MGDNGDAVTRELPDKNLSKQPRFGKDVSPTEFFMSIYNWYKGDEEKEPKYEANSSKRDMYLRAHVRKNPNIAGILNSVIDIDKNRGWRLVGGRNQVARFTEMLHGFEVAPGMRGWRPGISFSSQSFWESNMGFVTELGRDGIDGPIRKLYTVDPVRCKLTGNVDFPLEYTSTKSKSAKRFWRGDDFFRGASNISNDESLHGLGYCAVDRALTLSKLMLALYEHDFEEMGSRAPRGLLLLQGISQTSWNTAMEARDANLDSVGYDYYGALAVLASAAKNIDAKLLSLSQLPKGFNMREFMDMLMYGLALCFGYDPSEFWPVQFGALGRGTEMEVQHEKATGKGRLDFPLTYQEQLQDFLPPTLEFMFDQRDEKGDLLHASVNQAWVNVVKGMYESGLSQGAPLLTAPEARVLLADYGVIPRSWAPTDITAQTALGEVEQENEVNDGEEEEGNPEDKSDLEREPTPPKPADMKVRETTSLMKLLKDELMQSPHIWRCAEVFPQEPIVQYSWPGNTMIMLWERADNIMQKSMWQGLSLE